MATVTAFGKTFEVMFKIDEEGVWASIANEAGEFNTAWRSLGKDEASAVARLSWRMNPVLADTDWNR